MRRWQPRNLLRIMVDLKILEASGLTEANLKAWFAIDPLILKPGTPGLETETDDVQKRANLIWRIRSRVDEGRNRNFADYRTYAALDNAWDTPFRQVSPTLIQNFLDSNPNDENVYKQLQSWGLTNMISTRVDPKTQKEIKTLNLPVFFNIFVPLVRSYVTIRWAKIVNDRMLTPFFKYEPIKQTALLAAKCEAITDRMQIMASQYGYFDVMKQATLKMLHYGMCLQLPRNEWHWEEQQKYADEMDVIIKKAKAVGEVIEACVREGIEYDLPHISRTFLDISYPAYTINYDYGCEFYGYWAIRRWRSIRDNPSYWNRDKVSLGTVDLIGSNALFFQSVYQACTMTSLPCAVIPPPTPDGNLAAAEMGVGSPGSDRERAVARLYYGTEMGDQGVLVNQYFERLIPADNGMGSYKGPVWFRFLTAGDSGTILYCCPLPYAPGIYYGYDADESRTKNASLSLEVLPFQDHFSNMLSQILLTCKQNLANLAFIDEDQLLTGEGASKSKDVIDRIRNIGEQLFRSLNIFSYSSKRAAKMQAGPSRTGIPDVVQSFSFPKGNVQEMTNVLKTILDILERVLVMSSQEIAQAASHELRVDEVRNIQESTSSRLAFTATPVDIAMGAWKRQLYQGVMAYGDDDFWVHIPSDTPLVKEVLQKMGFTFVDHDKPSAGDRYIRALANKKTTAMNLWEFASMRDGRDRVDNAKLAMAMAQFVQSYMANPMTAQAIGAAQAIDLANYIAKLAGMPRDFKLRDMSPSPEQQQADAQAQLQTVIKEVLQKVEGEIKPLADMVDKNAMEIAVIFKALQLPLTDTHPANDSATPQSNAPAQAGGDAGVIPAPGVP